MILAIDTFPAERFGLITGSKCSVMFPDRGDGKKGMTTYAKQLANERFFQFYDERSSWQTDHGKMAEHFAFEYYNERHKEIRLGRFLRKGDCGGSTDAECDQYGLDFKCPTTLSGWLDYIYDGVDKDQYHQCQMYMYLTGLTEWRICAFLTETQFMTDNGLIYPVPQDKRMVEISVPLDPEWNGRLNESLPFVIEKREEYLQILNTQFNDTI